MTPDPVCMLETETLVSAAHKMKERGIGDVIVLNDTSADVCGIVTDRDIVVRALAEDRDPTETTLGAICSKQLVAVRVNDTVDRAVKLMRDKAIRRLPVVDDGKAVGVLSIGDLAERFDQRSALAGISSAPGNV
jgi:CBS domain-containing protein